MASARPGRRSPARELRGWAIEHEQPGEGALASEPVARERPVLRLAQERLAQTGDRASSRVSEKVGGARGAKAQVNGGQGRAAGANGGRGGRLGLAKGEPRVRSQLPLKGPEELPKGSLGTALAEAAGAYAADRYPEALRLLRRVVSLSPGTAASRELLGLTYYRMGRWQLAIRELEAHHQLSGLYDQFPVLADCYRALGRYEEALALWLELRRASPSAEVVAEGRIVAAGVMADKGDIAGAVKLLEPSLRKPKPGLHDLRQWYVLADLYERAGDLPRARELFARVFAADPSAYDVGERLAALS